MVTVCLYLPPGVVETKRNFYKCRLKGVQLSGSFDQRNLYKLIRSRLFVCSVHHSSLSLLNWIYSEFSLQLYFICLLFTLICRCRMAVL
ncbi:hypothetical protein SLEP1_g57666 [Rubroshorea leprosula]|uniref:Uncharacterized protein n=1 Tax=Rubroshorea leprosula TaxID=152421 RepID=A0AAV5MQ71_9ROSI|nr:hypothetical protein SLEP1_g57666 [Rubroshorea leprosula]